MFDQLYLTNYLIEIYSRSLEIKSKCRNLLSRDYASDSPLNLAKTLINICDFLDDVIRSLYLEIDWNRTERVKRFFRKIQTIDTIIRELGSHIRYIDGAQTKKLPYSFIHPLEKFITKSFPNLPVEMLFRPQWKYNYSLITDNLYDFYYNSLKDFDLVLTGKSIHDVLKKIKKSFYIISFPTLEQNNILLHCLIGHEIGHLLSVDFFSKNLYQQKLQLFTNEILKTSSPTNVDDIQSRVTCTFRSWKRGLDELISDLIGSIIFGPAVLFSVLEIATQSINGFDLTPTEDNNYYPPWRYRLRKIYTILNKINILSPPNDHKMQPHIIQGLTERVKTINEITDLLNDVNNINSDPQLKISYKEIESDLEQATQIFLEKLRGLMICPERYYKFIPKLVERLEFGIPPNANEVSVRNRQSANFVEVINATWLYKLSQSDTKLFKRNKINETTIETRDRMNRLTLKALEYCDLEEEYSRT